MTRIWQQRKAANEKIVRDYARRSPVLTCFGCADLGEEWRTIVGFDTRILVENPDGEIVRSGPVVIGIRFHERHLSEIPHPFEIAAILAPLSVFHPNCDRSGSVCLGRPQPGFSMELVLNQLWAGLMMNMKVANTRPREIINARAAAYVRDRVHQFPITAKGLFEDPDEDLRNTHWYVKSDPTAVPDDGMFFEEGSSRDDNDPVDD